MGDSVSRKYGSYIYFDIHFRHEFDDLVLFIIVNLFLLERLLLFG